LNEFKFKNCKLKINIILHFERKYWKFKYLFNAIYCHRI
jgi:hypothetical protein